MKHLSYFVALAAIGSFLILLGLEPFLFIAYLSVAAALGQPSSSENVRLGVNTAIAGLWMLALIGYWVRRRGLSPATVKAGHNYQLVGGHLCLVAGHALIACIFTIKAFQFLMILPVVGVLVLYASGTLLIELARYRGPSGQVVNGPGP